MTKVTTHNLGYPRIGPHRELKQSLERYWEGHISLSALRDQADAIHRAQLEAQRETGLDYVPVGDFALYDHVLEAQMALGVLPERFAGARQKTREDRMFYQARGRAPGLPDTDAEEMTKWFDTNYHYIVPELTAETRFELDAEPLLEQVHRARAVGATPKPVLVGPVSFLYLSKMKDGGDPLALLDQLLQTYREWLERLAEADVAWVQMDEPILALDLEERWQQALSRAYQALDGHGPQKLLTSYFAPLRGNHRLATTLPVSGLHIDAVRGGSELETVAAELPAGWVLSVGVIDGRSVWRNDLAASLARLEPLAEQLGERLWLAPSCSLLHVPQDLEAETGMDPEIRSWLAFARQKLNELETLRRGLELGREAVHEELETARAALESRNQSQRVRNPEVRKRMAAIRPEDAQRRSPFPERARLQQKRLGLPLLPTTTIGSFPQTAEIRRARRDHRGGRLSDAEYTQRMRAEIETVIGFQEETGLDVLVHGEPERNDMVEYFGEQLEGYIFTRLGWVQSYGSRCVKPPIIYGDVQRPQPMTVEWARYAQSLTDRPVKGMLTGPVTMLQWAFVRDDQPFADTARQIALALRDEIADLAEDGIAVIQVDEPALREGLPLRQEAWADYLAWATNAFRLATSGVTDDVQIHTHMCYAEFNDIIESIAALDADVITIETSRSDMELLDAFERFAYPNAIGPGIYDIHSPRVPETEEMQRRLEKAQRLIPVERLWVNPDCGLKTRGWQEVKPALENMVAAAQALRRQHGAG